MSEPNELPPDFPLPPASFSFLVESIMMQTQMQLGIFALDEEAEPLEPNLPVASHSIELLEMLQEKTRGNLTTEEHRMLENGLTELRFRFVQIAEELKAQQNPADKAQEKPLIVTTDGGKGSKTA